MIDLKHAEVAAFAEALNRLSAGVLLIDGRGHIVHANGAGHAILREGSVLRSMKGQLVAGEAHINKILRDTFAMADQGDATPGFRGIALPLQAPDG